MRLLRATAVLATLGFVIAASAVNDARAIAALAPNLEPLSASSLRLQSPGDGHTYLRFSTTSWNSGAGPLEIIGGATDDVTKKQLVYQRVYNDDGTYADTLAGSFDWHEEHGHIHFNDYAVYTLDPVNAPGASQRISSKTTFCIVDTTRVSRAKTVSKQPVYTTCGSQVQGMSVGWGDTYGYSLAGQEIDVTGLPDGDYALTIEIDPKKRIIETDDGDNVSVVQLRLRNGVVSVLGGRKH